MLGLKDISRQIQGPLTYKSLQLERNLHKAASSRGLTHRTALLPLLSENYTDDSSNRIALCFERYIKSAKNFIKETPGFVSELRTQIVYLHSFNKKVAENSLRYPFTYAFEQLLLNYIFLECKVLYKRENYSQKAEQLVEDRILRLLVNIYNAYLRNRLVPADKIFGESAKAIINLCVQLRQCYDVTHRVIENIVVKLLSKTGQLEDALTLTSRRLPCSMDSFLKDTSAINIYKKITSSDYIKNSYVDNDEVITIEDQEKEVKNENVAVKLDQELEQLEKQVKRSKGILTIWLDEDNDLELEYRSEETAPNNGSHRQVKKRRNRYEALANLKPKLLDPDPSDKVKLEAESGSPFSDDDEDTFLRVGNVNSSVQNRVSDAFKIRDDEDSDDDVVIVEPTDTKDCQKVIESSCRIDAIPSNKTLSIEGVCRTANDPSTVVHAIISSQEKETIIRFAIEDASEEDEISKSGSNSGTLTKSADKSNRPESIDGSQISNINKSLNNSRPLEIGSTDSENSVIIVDDKPGTSVTRGSSTLTLEDNVILSIEGECRTEADPGTVVDARTSSQEEDLITRVAIGGALQEDDKSKSGSNTETSKKSADKSNKPGSIDGLQISNTNKSLTNNEISLTDSENSVIVVPDKPGASVTKDSSTLEDDVILIDIVEHIILHNDQEGRLKNVTLGAVSSVSTHDEAVDRNIQDTLIGDITIAKTVDQLGKTKQNSEPSYPITFSNTLNEPIEEQIVSDNNYEDNLENVTSGLASTHDEAVIRNVQNTSDETKQNSESFHPEIQKGSTTVKKDGVLNESIEKIVPDNELEDSSEKVISALGSVVSTQGEAVNRNVEDTFSDIDVHHSLPNVITPCKQDILIEATVTPKTIDELETKQNSISSHPEIQTGSTAVGQEPIEENILLIDHEDNLKNVTSGAQSVVSRHEEAVHDELSDSNIPHPPTDIIPCESQLKQDTSIGVFAASKTVNKSEETKQNSEYANEPLKTNENTEYITDTDKVSVTKYNAVIEEQALTEEMKEISSGKCDLGTPLQMREVVAQEIIGQATSHTLTNDSSRPDDRVNIATSTEHIVSDTTNEPREALNKAKVSYVDLPLYQDYADDISAIEDDLTANEIDETIKAGMEISDTSSLDTEDTTSDNESVQEMIEIRNSKSFSYEENQSDTVKDISVGMETVKDSLDQPTDQAIVNLEETIKCGVEICYTKPSNQTVCQKKSMVQIIIEQFSEEEVDVDTNSPKTAETLKDNANKSSESLKPRRVTRSKSIADNLETSGRQNVDSVLAPRETVIQRQTIAADFSGEKNASTSIGGVPIKIPKENTCAKQTRNTRSKSMCVDALGIVEENNSTVDTERCRSVSVAGKAESSIKIMTRRSKSVIEKMADGTKRLELDSNSLTDAQPGCNELVTGLSDLQQNDDSVIIAQNTFSPRQTRSKSQSEKAVIMVAKIVEEFSSEEEESMFIENSDVTPTVEKNANHESSNAIRIATRSRSYVSETSSEGKNSTAIENSDITKEEKNMDQESTGTIQMTKSRSTDIVSEKSSGNKDDIVIENTDVKTVENQESINSIQITTRSRSKNIDAGKSSQSKDSIVIDNSDAKATVHKNMDQPSVSTIQLTTRSRDKGMVAEKISDEKESIVIENKNAIKTLRKNIDQESASSVAITTSKSKDKSAGQVDIPKLQDSGSSSSRLTSISNCRTTKKRSKSIFLETSCDGNESEPMISQENMKTQAVSAISENNTGPEFTEEVITETSVVMPDHIDILDSSGEKSDGYNQHMTTDDSLEQADQKLTDKDTPTLDIQQSHHFPIDDPVPESWDIDNLPDPYEFFGGSISNLTSEYKSVPIKGTRNKSDKILVHSVVVITSPKKSGKHDIQPTSGELQIAKELNCTTEAVNDSRNVKESNRSVSTAQINTLIDENLCETNSQLAAGKELLPQNVTSVEYQKEMMRKVRLYVKLQRSEIINSGSMECMNDLSKATDNGVESTLQSSDPKITEKLIEDGKSVNMEILDTEKSCTGATKILKDAFKAVTEDASEHNFIIEKNQEVHIEETVTIPDTEEGISHETKTNHETHEDSGDKNREDVTVNLKQEINICQTEETSLEKTVKYSEAEVKDFVEPVYETLGTLEPVVDQENSGIEKIDQPGVQLESLPVFENIPVFMEVEIITESASKDGESSSMKDLSDDIRSVEVYDSDYQVPSTVETHDNDTESVVEVDPFLPADDLNVHKEEIVAIQSDDVEKSNAVTTVAPEANMNMIMLADVAAKVLQQEQQPEKKRGRKKKVIPKEKAPPKIKRKDQTNEKEIQSEQVTESAAHKLAELNFKPDDFLPRNTTSVPPANNVYVHKIDDVNVTSEESNDSETNNLQIDEGLDVKHSPAAKKQQQTISLDTAEKMTQEKDPLSLYDEDTLEESLEPEPVFLSIPETDGSVIDDLLDPLNFENSLGDVQDPLALQTVDTGINECSADAEVTISEAKDPEVHKQILLMSQPDGKFQSHPSVVDDANFPPKCETKQGIEEYPLSVQKLGSVPSKHAKKHVFGELKLPIKNMAQRKRLNPYVSIERLNDKFQYIEDTNLNKSKSQSVDIGAVNRLSAGMDQSPLEEFNKKYTEIVKKKIESPEKVEIAPDADMDEVPLLKRLQLEGDTKEAQNEITGDNVLPQPLVQEPVNPLQIAPKKKIMNQYNKDTHLIETLNQKTTEKSPNNKYYTTPKLRRKSQSTVNLDRAASEKPTTEQISLDSDVIIKPIEILPNCKSTISPTTEKLKKKLECDGLHLDFLDTTKAIRSRKNASSSRKKYIGMNVYEFDAEAEDSEEGSKTDYRRNKLRKSRLHNIFQDKYNITEAEDFQDVIKDRTEKHSTANVDPNKKKRQKPQPKSITDDKLDEKGNRNERLMRNRSQSDMVETQTRIETNDTCIENNSENRNAEKITYTTEPESEKGFIGNNAKVSPEEIDRIIKKYQSIELGSKSSAKIEVSSDQGKPITQDINVRKIARTEKLHKSKRSKTKSIFSERTENDYLTITKTEETVSTPRKRGRPRKSKTILDEIVKTNEKMNDTTSDKCISEQHDKRCKTEEKSQQSGSILVVDAVERATRSKSKEMHVEKIHKSKTESSHSDLLRSTRSKSKETSEESDSLLNEICGKDENDINQEGISRTTRSKNLCEGKSPDREFNVQNASTVQANKPSAKEAFKTDDLHGSTRRSRSKSIGLDKSGQENLKRTVDDTEKPAIENVSRSRRCRSRTVALDVDENDRAAEKIVHYQEKDVLPQAKVETDIKETKLSKRSRSKSIYVEKSVDQIEKDASFLQEPYTKLSTEPETKKLSNINKTEEQNETDSVKQKKKHSSTKTSTEKVEDKTGAVAEEPVTENLNRSRRCRSRTVALDIDENDRAAEKIVHNQEKEDLVTQVESAAKVETDMRETKLSKRSRSKSIYVEKNNEQIETDATYLQKPSTKLSTESETKKWSNVNKTDEQNETDSVKQKEKHSFTKTSTEKVKDKTGAEAEETVTEILNRSRRCRSRTVALDIDENDRAAEKIVNNQEKEGDLVTQVETAAKNETDMRETKLSKRSRSKSIYVEKSDDQIEKDASFLQEPYTKLSTEPETKKLSNINKTQEQNETDSVEQKENHSSTKTSTEKVIDKTGAVAEEPVTENLNRSRRCRSKTVALDIDENDRAAEKIVNNQEKEGDLVTQVETAAKNEIDVRETKLSKRSRSKSIYVEKSNDQIEKDASFLQEPSTKLSTESETKKLSRIDKTEEQNETDSVKQKEKHSSTKTSTVKVEDKTGAVAEETVAENLNRSRRCRSRTVALDIDENDRAAEKIVHKKEKEDVVTQVESAAKVETDMRETKLSKRSRSKSIYVEKSNDQIEKDASFLLEPSTKLSTESETKKLSNVNKTDEQNETDSVKQKEKHSFTKTSTEKVKDKTGAVAEETVTEILNRSRRCRSRTVALDIDENDRAAEKIVNNQEKEGDLVTQVETAAKNETDMRETKLSKRSRSKSIYVEKSNDQIEKDASFLLEPSTKLSTESETKKLSRIDKTEEQNETDSVKQKEKHSSTKMSTEKAKDKTGAVAEETVTENLNRSRRCRSRTVALDVDENDRAAENIVHNQEKEDVVTQVESAAKVETDMRETKLSKRSRSKSIYVEKSNDQIEKDASFLLEPSTKLSTESETKKLSRINKTEEQNETVSVKQKEKHCSTKTSTEKIKDQTGAVAEETVTENLNRSRRCRSRTVALDVDENDRAAEKIVNNQEKEGDLVTQVETAAKNETDMRESKLSKRSRSKSIYVEKSNDQIEKDASFLLEPSTKLSTESETKKLSRIDKTEEQNETDSVKQKEKHSSTKMSTEKVKDKTGTEETKSKSISAKIESEQNKNDQQKKSKSRTSKSDGRNENLDDRKNERKTCDLNQQKEQDSSDKLSKEKYEDRKEKGSKIKKQVESKTQPAEKCDNQNKNKINRKSQENKTEISTDLPTENDKNRAELKQSKIKNQSRSKCKSLEGTDPNRIEKYRNIDKIDQQKAVKSSAKMIPENAAQKEREEVCEVNKEPHSKNKSIELKVKVDTAKLSAEKSVQKKHDAESKGKESKLEESHKLSAKSEYAKEKTDNKCKNNKELRSRTKSAGKIDFQCEDDKRDERKEKVEPIKLCVGKVEDKTESVGSEIKKRSKSPSNSVEKREGQESDCGNDKLYEPKLDKLNICNEKLKTNDKEKIHTKEHIDISGEKKKVVESRLRRSRSKSDNDQSGIEPEPKRIKTDDPVKQDVEISQKEDGICTHRSKSLSKEKNCMETSYKIPEVVPNKCESENEKNKVSVEENQNTISEKPQEKDADMIKKETSEDLEHSDDPKSDKESKIIFFEQKPSSVESEHVIDTKVKCTLESLEETELKPNKGISHNASMFKHKKNDRKEHKRSNKSSLRIHNDHRKKKRSADKITHKDNSEGSSEADKNEEIKPAETKLSPILERLSLKDKLGKFKFTTTKLPEHGRELEFALQQGFSVEPVQGVAPKKLSDIDSMHIETYQKNEIYVTKLESSVFPDTSEIKKPELNSKEDRYENQEMSGNKNEGSAFEFETEKVERENDKPETYDLASKNIEYNPICEITVNEQLSEAESAVVYSRKSKIEPDKSFYNAFIDGNSISLPVSINHSTELETNATITDPEKCDKSRRKSIMTNQIIGEDKQNIESEDVTTLQNSENVEAIDLSMKSNINKLSNLGLPSEDVKECETNESVFLNQEQKQNACQEEMASEKVLEDIEKVLQEIENRRKAKEGKEMGDDGSSRKRPKFDELLIEVDPGIKVSPNSPKSVSPGRKERKTVETIVSGLKENVKKSNEPVLKSIDISAMKGTISRKLKHTKEKDCIQNLHKEKPISVEENNDTVQHNIQESFESEHKREISDIVHSKSGRLRKCTTIASDNSLVTEQVGEPEKQVEITQQETILDVPKEESEPSSSEQLEEIATPMGIDESNNQIANEEVENIVSEVTENRSDIFKPETERGTVYIGMEEPKKRVKITQEKAPQVSNEELKVSEDISVPKPASPEQSKDIDTAVNFVESERQRTDKGAEKIVSGVTETCSDIFNAETDRQTMVDIEVEECKKRLEMTQKETTPEIPNEEFKILEDISVPKPATCMSVEESEHPITDERVEKIVSGVTENRSDIFKAETDVQTTFDVEVEEPEKQVEITQQETTPEVSNEESKVLEVPELASDIDSLEQSTETATPMNVEESEHQITDEGIENIVPEVTANCSEIFKAETDGQIVDIEVEEPKKQIEITQQETTQEIPKEQCKVLEISVSEPASDIVSLDQSKEIATSINVGEFEHQITDEEAENIVSEETDIVKVDEQKVDIGVFDEATLEKTDVIKETIEVVEASIQKESGVSLNLENAVDKDIEEESASDKSTNQMDTSHLAGEVVKQTVTKIPKDQSDTHTEELVELKSINQVRNDDTPKTNVPNESVETMNEVVESSEVEHRSPEFDISVEQSDIKGYIDQFGCEKNPIVTDIHLIDAKPDEEKSILKIPANISEISITQCESPQSIAKPTMDGKSGHVQLVAVSISNIGIEKTSSEINVEQNEKSSLIAERFPSDVKPGDQRIEVEGSSEVKCLSQFDVPIEKTDSAVSINQCNYGEALLVSDTGIKSVDAKLIPETMEDINSVSAGHKVKSDTSYQKLNDEDQVGPIVTLPVAEIKPVVMKSDPESIKPIRERHITTNAEKFDEPSMHKDDDIALEMETVVDLSPPYAEVTLEPMQCVDVETEFRITVNIVPDDTINKSSVTTKYEPKSCDVLPENQKTPISNSNLQTDDEYVETLSQNSTSCDSFVSVESCGNSEIPSEVTLAEEVKIHRQMVSEIIRSVKEFSNSENISSATPPTVPDMNYIQSDVPSDKAHKLLSGAVGNIHSRISVVTVDPESEMENKRLSKLPTKKLSSAMLQSPKSPEESEHVENIAKETSRTVPKDISDVTTRSTESTAVYDTPKVYEHPAPYSTCSAAPIDESVHDVDEDSKAIANISNSGGQKPNDRLDSGSVLAETTLKSGKMVKEPPSFQGIPTTLASIISDHLLPPTKNLSQIQTSSNEADQLPAVKENKEAEVYFSSSTMPERLVERNKHILTLTTEDLQSELLKTIQSSPVQTETVDSSMVDGHCILNNPCDLDIGKTVEVLDQSDSSSSQTYLEPNKFISEKSTGAHMFSVEDTFIDVSSMADLELMRQLTHTIEYKCEGYVEGSNDHTYYMGDPDPLFSGKLEEKSILPSNPTSFSKQTDDFPLNDRQMMELSEYVSEDLNQNNTEQLSVANEYAVKHLLLLGGQPSSDTIPFNSSDYGECMNLIDVNIPSSESGVTNKSADFSWMQYMNEENPNPCQLPTNIEANPKVVVVLNECLTPTFNISTTDIMESFSERSNENSSSSLRLEAELPSNSPPRMEDCRKDDTSTTTPKKNPVKPKTTVSPNAVKPKTTASQKLEEIPMLPVRRHSRTPVMPPPKKKPPPEQHVKETKEVKNDLKRQPEDSPPCKVFKIDTSVKDVPILDIKKGSGTKTNIKLPDLMNQGGKIKDDAPSNDPAIKAVFKSAKCSDNALPSIPDSVVHQTMFDPTKLRKIPRKEEVKETKNEFKRPADDNSQSPPCKVAKIIGNTEPEAKAPTGKNEDDTPSDHPTVKSILKSAKQIGKASKDSTVLENTDNSDSAVHQTMFDIIKLRKRLCTMNVPSSADAKKSYTSDTPVRLTRQKSKRKSMASPAPEKSSPQDMPAELPKPKSSTSRKAEVELPNITDNLLKLKPTPRTKTKPFPKILENTPAKYSQNFLIDSLLKKEAEVKKRAAKEESSNERSGSKRDVSSERSSTEDSSDSSSESSDGEERGKRPRLKSDNNDIFDKLVQQDNVNQNISFIITPDNKLKTKVRSSSKESLSNSRTRERDNDSQRTTETQYRRPRAADTRPRESHRVKDPPREYQAKGYRYDTKDFPKEYPTRTSVPNNKRSKSYNKWPSSTPSHHPQSSYSSSSNSYYPPSRSRRYSHSRRQPPGSSGADYKSTDTDRSSKKYGEDLLKTLVEKMKKYRTGKRDKQGTSSSNGAEWHTNFDRFFDTFSSPEYIPVKTPRRDSE